MNQNRTATSFSLKSGEPCYFHIPWDATENELKMCEEIIALQFSAIRSYQARVGVRHEWWVKWRGFAP